MHSLAHKFEQMANPTDASLQPFISASFHPVDYLNNALPSLSLSNQPHALKPPRSVPLADLSAQTQSFLTQLNAQNSRLSNTLTQLTDEILRSGGRLAYEVEVLRGESIGLSETLTDALQDDMRKFVPSVTNHIVRVAHDGDTVSDQRNTSNNTLGQDSDHIDKEQQSTLDPPFLRQLRMLSQVRNRLEEVIQTFGDAMEWPLPPSDVSIASSFISVSGPDSTADSHSREEKGREVARKFRDQITELLESDGGGEAGLEAAENRLEELRTLAVVWKGTAEEKARNKFVDSLAKQVEDRRKQLESQAGDLRQRSSSDQSPRRTPSKKGRPSMEQIREERGGSEGGSGFMRNLQRLRDEIYLE
jgi:hypothetical protein